MEQFKIKFINILIVSILCSYTLAFKTIENSDESGVMQCVNKIYSQTQELYTFLVSSVEKNSSYLEIVKNNSGLLIVTDNNLDLMRNLWKFQMMVFLVESVEQFEFAFTSISKIAIWNSRAKFLVGYFGQDDFKEIFNIFWRLHAMNVNVIAKNGSQVNVYTYFPYKEPNCGEFDGHELIASCEQDKFDNVFPSKVPLDLHGCAVKVMAYVIPPFVINLTKPNNDPSQAGVEVTIIHNVAKKMNITLNFVKNPHKHWGYHYNDGSYTLMYKSLMDRETDMIFGFTFANYSFREDFDGSFCHLSDSSVWFFPTAPKVAQWKNLINIFERNLWIAIFLMALINGIFWWIIGRNREPSDDYNDLVICIMSSMYILLQGGAEDPKTGKVRLVFILWLMMCILISTAYQSQLISILTSEQYEPQMTTLHELIASGSAFGFYPVALEAYKEPTPINIIINERYDPCPLTEECLNRTAYKRDYAVVKNKRQVRYLMPRMYTFPNGRPMLYDTDITLFETKERFYFYKWFPFMERFNNILMLLASNGLTNKWDKDSTFFVLKLKSDDEDEPLTLGHLQTAFFVYFLGITTACLAFLYEVIAAKYKDRRNTAKLN